MNLEDAERELKAWFARVTGIPADLVTYEGDPVGMREPPWAELKLSLNERPQPGDEVRLSRIEGDDTALAVEAIGNRGCRLLCRVRNRSQRPNERAQAVLERVRARLELPSTIEAFDAAGLAFREAFAIVEMPVENANRMESEAVLELAFNYVSSSLEGEAETAPRLEGVRYRGTAREGSNTITVPETTVMRQETP